MKNSSDTKAVDIRNVPEDIRAAVDADARERGMSVADRVLEILGDRYGLTVQLSGRPYVGTSGSNHWNVRMPPALYERVKAHATGGRSMVGCVLSAVAAEQGIPFSPTRRNPRALGPTVIHDLKVRHRNGESIRSLAREVGVKRETLSRAIRA